MHQCIDNFKFLDIIKLYNNKKGCINVMKYIKTPGEIYDLFKLFIYNFNKEDYDKKILNGNSREFELLWKTVLNGSQINDKLYMFFYKLNNKSTFMTEHFFTSFYNDFTDPDFFTNMCERIRSMDLFVEILKYYLDKDSFEIRDVYSADYIYELSLKIDIPDRIRLQILHFNYNRNQYSDILINELKEKHELIKNYYSENSNKIDEIKNSMLNDLIQLNLCKEIDLSSEYMNTYYYSVSLLQDKFYAFLNNQNKDFIVIGYDSINNLDYINKFKNNVNISKVSKALSDEFRIIMLNFIKEIGEITTSDIAREFNMGLTAMYYHLSMLYEAKILSTRNEGRTVFYKINSEFLEIYSEFIKRFALEGGVNL